MKEQIMIDEVVRYLNDDTYNYALMLDGEWGCGKTHFITHTLMKCLNQIEIDGETDRVRYYSVCSCDTLATFRDTIAYDLVKQRVEEIPVEISKEISKKNADDENNAEGSSEKKTAGEVIREKTRALAQDAQEFVQKKIIEEKIKNNPAYAIGMNIGGKVISGLVESKMPFMKTIDAGEYLAEVKDLKKYIFVFDDIERCSYSIHDLLCFITELVEQIHAKVILVINEDELKKDYKQYTAYLRIKEKLIGCTLVYSPDIVDIFKSITDEQFEDECEIKKPIWHNLEQFAAQMTERRHYSLRTFLFFITRMKYIHTRLKEADKEFTHDDFEKIYSVMVPECFDMCLNYKDAQYSDNAGKDIELPDNYRFLSVNRYVQTGLFDIDTLVKKEIPEVLKTSN